MANTSKLNDIFNYYLIKFTSMIKPAILRKIRHTYFTCNQYAKACSIDIVKWI